MPTRVLLPTYSMSSWASNVDDDFGCRWIVTSQDFGDGPGVKLRTAPRPYQTGSYRSTSFRDARSNTMQGWVATSDRVATQAARSRFLALFPLGSQHVLVIDDGIQAKQLTVELAADPKVALWPDGGGFTWQLETWAADPRYYDTTVDSASTSLPTAGGVGLNWVTGGGLNWVTGGGLNWGTTASNGTLVLTNTGNADTWPTFTLTGPLVGPITITASTGQQLAYSGNVLIGETLVITTSPFGRSVLLNGSDRFTLMTRAEWMPIPANSSVTFAFSALAGTGILAAAKQNASW